MAGPVVRQRVGDRRGERRLLEQPGNLDVGWVHDENRTGMRADRFDLPGPVDFLLRTRVLVPTYAVGDISGDRAGRGEAGLDVFARVHAVRVVAGSRLADQHALIDHPAESERGLGVNFGSMSVGYHRKIDLGPRYVQKTPRPASRRSLGLGEAQDVIGPSGDLRRPLRNRPDGGERPEQRRRRGIRLHQPFASLMATKRMPPSPSTSSSTAFRPADRAALTFAESCAGVETASWATSMIRS